MADLGGQTDGSDESAYWRQHYGIGSGPLSHKARPGCMAALFVAAAVIAVLLVARVVIAIA